MAEHNYHFAITMTCGGCSGAIERVLKRMDGIQSFTVNLEKQTADVIADQAVAYADVLAVIKKTGKNVTAAVADGVEMSVV